MGFLWRLHYIVRVNYRVKHSHYNSHDEFNFQALSLPQKWDETESSDSPVMWMVGSPGNQLPSLGAFRNHLLNINSNQKRFVMNIKATLLLLGNFKGFRSSVPETGTEIYIFITNHNITGHIQKMFVTSK